MAWVMLEQVTQDVRYALRGMRKNPRLLFETTPADPATLAAVAGAVLVIVLPAALIPANREARVDPTVALRYE